MITDNKMQIIILIPAYNEASSLPQVINELHEIKPKLQILVVDDASTDGSGDLLPQLPVRHLQLGQHLGLGGALRAGLRYARTLGADVVVRLDGDGQHRPQDIDQLLEPVIVGHKDAAVGSRFAGKGAFEQSTARSVMQTAMARSLSRIMGKTISDPTSGFWAFGPRAVRLLADHHPRGYPEPELHLFLHRNHLDVVEVGVEMRERLGGRSSLSAGRAFLALLRTMMAMIIVPLRGQIEGSLDG